MSEDRSKRGYRNHFERQQVRDGVRFEERVRKLFGRTAAALGMLLAVLGSYSPSEAGPSGEIGIAMGMLGYLLGARRLGVAAVVLSIAELLFS